MGVPALQSISVSKEIFDRNPTSQNAQFVQNNVAPHGDTLRATYTTPALKLAEIQLIEAFVFRKQVAGTVDNVIVKIKSSISGRLATIIFRKNVVGDVFSTNFSRNLILEAGEIITIETEDDSTGGQINYAINVAITEFDLF